MRTFLTAVLFMTATFAQLSADQIPLRGKFVSDPEKTAQWMVDNDHPAVKKAGSHEKLKKAMGFPDNPLIHEWKDGELKVSSSKAGFLMAQKLEWKKIDDVTYRSVKAADKHNTELVREIKITGSDSYYIQVTVNKTVSREFFSRPTP